MSATEIVSVGIELISLALAKECRKILETRKKRRPRRWWVKPWIRRREQLGASTRLLVELAAEDSDSYRNYLRITVAQLDFLLQKVSPLIQKADTFLRPALPAKLKLQITLHYLATGTCFCKRHLRTLLAQLLTRQNSVLSERHRMHAPYNASLDLSLPPTTNESSFHFHQ